MQEVIPIISKVKMFNKIKCTGCVYLGTEDKNICNKINLQLETSMSSTLTTSYKYEKTTLR